MQKQDQTVFEMFLFNLSPQIKRNFFIKAAGNKNRNLIASAQNDLFFVITIMELCCPKCALLSATDIAYARFF